MPFAYLNHGRWMVDCSICGAHWVAKTDRLHCLACNGGPGRLTEHVYWPPDKKLDELRRIMRHRPIEARNWQRGELTAHLIAENIEHGVEPL